MIKKIKKLKTAKAMPIHSQVMILMLLMSMIAKIGFYQCDFQKKIRSCLFFFLLPKTTDSYKIKLQINVMNKYENFKGLYFYHR